MKIYTVKYTKTSGEDLHIYTGTNKNVAWEVFKHHSKRLEEFGKSKRLWFSTGEQGSSNVSSQLEMYDDAKNN